jgi:hypothetical protein
VPVVGLEPGTTYSYQVCAGDNDNPDGFCGPRQTFRTLGTGVPTFRSQNRECTGPNDFNQSAFVVNFEPGTTYGFRAQFLEGASGDANTPFETDANGNADLGSIGLTQPFRARVVIWLDPDEDFVQDPEESVLLDSVYGADEPCTDAQPEEPANS